MFVFVLNFLCIALLCLTLFWDTFTDSIDQLFGKVYNLQENMKYEDFKTAVDKVPDFISEEALGFFRFVKSKRDRNGTSFLFVTSKPMQYVIRLPLIAHYMDGNYVSKNVDCATFNGKSLALQLSDKEIDSYVKLYLKEWAPLFGKKEQELTMKKLEGIKGRSEMAKVGRLQSMLLNLNINGWMEEEQKKMKESETASKIFR